jgi:hypothetical protein
MKHKSVLWLALLIVIGTAGLVLLLVPWPSTVAPSIRLRVFDETGAPARNIVVTQRWGHYNFDSEREASSRTDDNGYVDFPARLVKANGVSRVIKPIVGTFTHEGSGPYAQIHAYGSDPYVWTSVPSSVKDPLPRELHLKRRDVPLYP